MEHETAVLDSLVDVLVERVVQRVRSVVPPVDSEWLNTAQAATLLGLQKNTLEIWRHKGMGPRFFKMGRNVCRYKRADVIEYLERGPRTSTSAPVKLRRAK